MSWTPPERPRWVNLASEWQGLSQWFARSEIEDSRTWLLDSGGWVLADSGPDSGAESGSDTARGQQRATWLQRFLYRMVAGSRTELLENWPADPVRLNGEVVSRALAGAEAVSWTQDIDTAVVWNTVAVPVILQDSVHGAIVVQSTSDGLLLVTNRALGRLLFTNRSYEVLFHAPRPVSNRDLLTLSNQALDIDVAEKRVKIRAWSNGGHASQLRRYAERLG